MPLYLCNAVRGVIPDPAKAKIATDLTEIHCELTGAARDLVHVFFFEDAPQLPINGKCVFLFGSHCSGEGACVKRVLLERMKAAIFAHSGVPMGEIMADLTEIPGTWVMEGGTVGGPRLAHA